MQENPAAQPSQPSEPPFPSQPPPALPPAPPPDEKQTRMWNMFCHLSALAGFIVPVFGNILGPLLVWQIKKQEFPSVEVHGKAALNFQISVTIAALVASILGLTGLLFCIGLLFFFVAAGISLAGIIFAVIAGIKANDGLDYRYPWSLTLIG